MVAEAAKAAATEATNVGKNVLSGAFKVATSKWTWIAMGECLFAAPVASAAALSSFAAAPSVGAAGTVATTAGSKGAPAIFTKLGALFTKGAGATEMVTQTAGAAALASRRKTFGTQAAH